jgi:molybdopterin-guanine dinucleotide biosynthesis protein MobB
MLVSDTPVVGFVAYSGTGKTTLLEQLIPLLSQGGVRLAMIKHAHHEFDIDQPGKDSYRLRKAGARQMLITSSRRWALMVENPLEEEPSLQASIDRLDHGELDLILVEGFKHEAYAKIELYRPSLGKEPIYPGDEHVVAVATDQPEALDTKLPILDINAPGAIANFLLAHYLGRAQA